ncbi:MAG TPA: AI-2E family transporter [Thermomicrobiales bacterium]|nr:AI-2E family transporter [Thermomicrobiales bacterium]
MRDGQGNLPPQNPDVRVVAAQRHAAQQWRRLGDRLQTMTPSALVRILLASAAIAAPIWLTWATWPAIAPFLIGAAIAYAVLPLVNTLNRVMPRLPAALLATGMVITLVIAVPLLILRVLAIELYGTYRSLPTNVEIRQRIQDLDQSMDGWPEPIRIFVRTRALDTLLSIRERFVDYVSGVDGLAIDVVMGTVNAIGVFLGLLVLPVWILLALRDQGRARDAINQRLPDWLEADFWAITRILDRTLGTYIRGLSVIAITIGVGTFAGLWALDAAGAEGIRYPVALALLVGILELIPTIGPILSTLSIFLITLRGSPESAIAAVLVVIVVRLLVRRFVASRIEQRVIDVHPAILIVVLVALSQFGLIWAILAAPIVAIVRDVFRYTYGRVSDPPRPAGLLPGEPAPSTAHAMPATRALPLVYQRASAARAPSPLEPVERAAGE